MSRFYPLPAKPTGKFANFDERLNAPLEQPGQQSQTPPIRGVGKDTPSSLPGSSNISDAQAKKAIAAYQAKQQAEKIGKAAGKAAVVKIMAEEREKKAEREKREASDSVWAKAMESRPVETASSPVSATGDIWDQARAANEAWS